MVIVRGATRLVRLGLRLENLASAGLTGLGAGLGAGLSLAERKALTWALYQRAGGENRALFPWEIKWFDETLPPPPGRILVAGAGAGAEVVALKARGYAVGATEPVERLAGLCEAQGAEVWRLEHEALGRLAGQRFDAVLFGWGSLSHVLTEAGRKRSVEAAAQLTDGPILASYWSAEASSAPSGRAARLGARVGRQIGRMRGLPPAPEHEYFGAWCGFGSALGRPEIAALAIAFQREVQWGEGPYAHAAWVPVR